MNLKDLKKEIPYKWRVQSFSKYKPQATCVAYIDARDCMDLLDEVCGQENWQVRYKEINGKLFAEVGIDRQDSWIWKSDTGSESNIEKDKGLVSDSFKRACVHWGIGRFLYSLMVKYVDANEKKTDSNRPFPVDKSNQRIYDLSEYFSIETPKKATQTNPAVQKEPDPYLRKLTLSYGQYSAMIKELGTGKWENVESKMNNYTITLDQQDNLENAIKEAKSFTN